MALIVADRVKETSTTTGTGALTLAGAATGFRAFSAVCSTNDTCYYAIQAVDGSGVPTGDWEVGLGTYSAANELTRTTVISSSNSNSVVTLAAGTKQVWLDFAAAQVVNSNIGKHAIYIAAGSISPSVTGGCAALAKIASAANQPDIVTLDFDATTQEYAQFSVVMPKKWNEGTVTFKAHWSHSATTTNFGVVWDLQAVAVSDDDAIAVAFGTAQTSTDTGGTTNDLYTSPESSAITVSGTPAAEDTVFFRLSRVTGNGSDTMAIDARLHGITLYITTDAETDA